MTLLDLSWAILRISAVVLFMNSAMVGCTATGVGGGGLLSLRNRVIVSRWVGTTGMVKSFAVGSSACVLLRVSTGPSALFFRGFLGLGCFLAGSVALLAWLVLDGLVCGSFVDWSGPA